ncbi:MAG TPA: sulfatase [Nocardioidaceae bacterium]|nr:sulfatase [Nocardioidaceae bacterium]
MPHRRAASVLVIILVLAATQAVADTVRVDDPKDAVGRHDILSLKVDNTGELVGATVKHRGAGWRGRVKLEFDVSGGPLPEFVAVISHSRTPQAVFRRGDGTPWRCASRRTESRSDRVRTILRAGRGCFAGASQMRVRVTASSPEHASDAAASGVVRQQTRPNVVLIMVDDMRVDDLRYMPWTRRLIGAQGVTFRNSFSPHPLCCPARASGLVGQYTHNHRVFTVKPPYAFTSFDDSSTLATWLRGSGYATVYLGKYLNGYGTLPKPGETSGQSIYYVPPGWTEWRASIDGGLAVTDPKAGNTYQYFDTTLSDNGEGFDNYEGRYQSRVYGGLTEETIASRAASDAPFFLYASYTAPHNGGPIEPDDPGTVTRSDGTTTKFGTPGRPDHVKGMFDNVIPAAPGASWEDPDPSDKPDYLRALPAIEEVEWRAMRNLTRQRAEALHVVDKQVRRTIEALTASGELEETMVMFTSDNGYFLGEQRMRQGKIFPHEPAVRVPMLVRGPGIPAGEHRFDPIMSMDLAPTVARLAGVEPAGMVDGVSMLNVARHGDTGWQRAVLTETGPGSFVRFADETGTPLDIDDPGERDRRWALGIRTDRYLYTDLASGDGLQQFELYDMATDPNQYHNLVADPDYADILALLRAELQRVRACDGAACSAPMAAELTTAPGESILNRP